MEIGEAWTISRGMVDFQREGWDHNNNLEVVRTLLEQVLSSDSKEQTLARVGAHRSCQDLTLLHTENPRQNADLGRLQIINVHATLAQHCEDGFQRLTAQI